MAVLIEHSQRSDSLVLKRLADIHKLFIGCRYLNSILVKDILVVKYAGCIRRNRKAVDLSVIFDRIQHVRLHIGQEILIRNIEQHVVVHHLLENRIGCPVRQNIRHIISGHAGLKHRCGIGVVHLLNLDPRIFLFKL